MTKFLSLFFLASLCLFALSEDFSGYLNQFPQIKKEPGMIKISISPFREGKIYMLYYRTEKHRSFQVRMMKVVENLLTVTIQTEVLDGRNLEYYFVEKDGKNKRRSPLYSLEEVSSNQLPEIYFQQEVFNEGESPPLPSYPLISISGSGSFNQRLYEKEESTAQGYNLNGNLRLFRNVYQNDGEFCFDATLSYLNPSIKTEKAVNLTSMLVHFKAKNNIFEAGDININHTEFSAYGLSRRGLKYEHNSQNIYLNAFWVNSQQLTGFDGFGIPESKASIFGGGGGFKLGDRISLRTILISGKDNLDSKTAWSSEPAYSAGSLFSAWATFSPFKNNILQLNGEFAHSSFGRSSSADTINKDGANAWKTGLILIYRFLNFNFDYQSIDQNFSSIANLFLQKDRKGLQSSLGFNLNKVNLSLNYADQKTNINNPLEAMLNQRKFGANLSYMIGNSWRIGADFTLDNLDYDTSTGKSTSSSDMNTTAYNGSIAFIAGSTNINLILGKRMTRNFTSDFSGTLNLSFSFSRFLTLAPTISFQNQKNNATTEAMKVYNAFIQATINFVPDWLSLATNFSYNSTKSNTFENQTINATANLALNLAKIFKQKINPLLSARGQYQKTTSIGLNSENFSFWLQFDLSF